MSKKVALITGSTRGIGLSIAESFAANGYNVMLSGIETSGDFTASELAKRFNTEVAFAHANMMEPAEVKRMVSDTESRFGRLDVLINNAGIQHVSPVEEFPDEKWDAIIAINLTAAFHACKAAWPGMKARQFGRIINIASAHGLRASEFKSAYVAAKHGIVGLTKVMALEGAVCNITANAICPGYVLTPLVEGQIKDQAKAFNISEDEVVQKIMLKKHAVKDFVTAEFLGKTALFLASEDASLITGVALPVDGGWTVQ
ncbi:MAG: 3-hydroxybutyrate dehydrogenase [Cytophagales bacterium]|nr:MAG: 3-hydroxybutyrate dehydrogenase [Cytophagales bacterium]TAF59913.1 MAG: 3-hydroxybutyrate dehydrogenase [Cytophagales bacterium]